MKQLIDRIKNRKLYKSLSDAGKKGAAAGECYDKFMNKEFASALLNAYPGNDPRFGAIDNRILSRFKPRTIKNQDRQWFQFWKPRRIPNPGKKKEIKLNIDIGKPDIPWSFICGKDQVLQAHELDNYLTIGIVKDSEYGDGELFAGIGVNVIPDGISYLDYISKLIDIMKKNLDKPLKLFTAGVFDGPVEAEKW